MNKNQSCDACGWNYTHLSDRQLHKIFDPTAEQGDQYTYICTPCAISLLNVFMKNLHSLGNDIEMLYNQTKNSVP